MRYWAVFILIKLKGLELNISLGFKNLDSTTFDLETNIDLTRYSMRKLLIEGFKGSDRLSMVVQLRMQYCGEIFQDSFETWKTF